MYCSRLCAPSGRIGGLERQHHQLTSAQRTLVSTRRISASIQDSNVDPKDKYREYLQVFTAHLPSHLNMVSEGSISTMVLTLHGIAESKGVYSKAPTRSAAW